jgi:phage-related protein
MAPASFSFAPFLCQGRRKEFSSPSYTASSIRRSNLAFYVLISIIVYMAEALRPVPWVGNTLKDLRAFPPAVRREMGQALFTAQQGTKDPVAKPLKGFGGVRVLEIAAAYQGNAWRAVYTVRFEDAIYVLHAFQKKSTRGISTPAREIELIRKRLAEAERNHRERRQEDEIQE